MLASSGNETFLQIFTHSASVQNDKTELSSSAHINHCSALVSNEEGNGSSA